MTKGRKNLNLEWIVLKCIIIDELIAEEMKMLARDFEARGYDADFVATLIDLSRRHRVMSLRGRAELAALIHQNGEDDDRNNDPSF